MIENIYSRKVVGWEVQQVTALLARSVWAEKWLKKDLVLHSDNGAPMKRLKMWANMYDLGVVTSRSQLRVVSDDDPYSESLFITVKYHPRWPSEGFKSFEYL